MVRKKDEIKDVDTVPEVAAYSIKRIFDSLKTWKTTLRLGFIIFIIICGVIAGKFILNFLTGP